MMTQLKLTVVSQEKLLVQTSVDQVTAPTSEGEITVLPNHIPLFTKLVTGEFSYVEGGSKHTVIVSQGFLTVDPNNEVMVIVDSATLDREISTQKAEAAIREAQETLVHSRDRREMLMAEASLKKAMLEMRIAERTKKSSI
jgi:F-type H+-transporting ATPase subunit epsilon